METILNPQFLNLEKSETMMRDIAYTVWFEKAPLLCGHIKQVMETGVPIQIKHYDLVLEGKTYRVNYAISSDPVVVAIHLVAPQEFVIDSNAV